MAIWTFEVVPDDGDPFTVDAGSRDVAAWERASGRTLKYLYEHMPIQEMYKVCHLAAIRQNLYTGNLADFLASCDIDIQTDPDPDPTDPGA